MSFAFVYTLTPPEGFGDFLQNIIKHVILPDGSSPTISPEDLKLYMQAFLPPSSKQLVGNNVETNKVRTAIIKPYTGDLCRTKFALRTKSVCGANLVLPWYS
ncbi:hypothetical protein BC936DRAFT_137213 [Jimgerdemannia flammicorona]|uniref:Uncharacterized protein n=1 Tax=Jimgerdemannia flammicorona TaxID=994334 RepID=A0A433CXV2_9FUNG|nr:hypothetical protein BC936DRAFT_137213 [Jimgerdemannia flammicorona]